MLDWLKEILGDAYTEDIDKRVSERVGKDFVPRKDFNEKNEALKTANTTIAERDKQLEDLKKSTGDAAELTEQIETLQAANKKQAEDHAAEMAAIKLDGAVEKALSGAHARNATAVKALLAEFLKSAELAEDGTVKGLSDEIKKLSDGEDTAFLFGEKPGVSGANPAGKSAPPGGQRKPMTFEQSVQAAIENQMKG